MRTLLFIMISLLLTAACTGAVMAAAASRGEITKASFGQTTDTQPAAVDLYTLKNAYGAECKITNYGGIVVPHRPGQDGKMADVVLGYDKLAGLPQGHALLRRLIGPLRQPHRQRQVHARRQAIHAGQNNNGAPSLHGGNGGLRQGRLEGQARIDRGRPGAGADLHQQGRRGRLPRQPGGHGRLHLTNDNELKLDYTATTDKPTVVNLTQPFLLQPGRRRQRRHPRARVPIRGQEFTAGR